MARENAFKVEGVILEVLSEKTYRVELANGHRLLAFVPGKRKAGFGPLAAGAKVRLRLSPYDLSVGRILTNRTGS